MRVPVVGLVSLAIATARGQARQVLSLDRNTWLLLLVAGILGWGVSSTLYALSVELAGPSLAMIIGATAPLCALPMSIWLLGERTTYRALVGTLLAIAGIVLVV